MAAIVVILRLESGDDPRLWIVTALTPAFYGFAVRQLWRPTSTTDPVESRMVRIASSWIATAFLVIEGLFRTAAERHGPGLVTLGLALFQVGLFSPMHEFRLQAYATALLGLLIIVPELVGLDARTAVGTLGWPAFITLLWFVQGASRRSRLGLEEQEAIPLGTSLATTLLLTAFVHYWAPDVLAPVLWMALALTVIETSRVTRIDGLWAEALLPGLVAYFSLLGDRTWADRSPIPDTATVALMFVAATRLRVAGQVTAGRASSFAAAFAAVVLSFMHLRSAAVAPTWTLLALMMLGVGVWRRNADWRAQGCLTLAAALIRCWFVNLAALADGRLLSVTAVVTGLFTAAYMIRWLAIRAALIPYEKTAAQGFTLAGVATLAALLFRETSSGLLTLAWGIEGLAAVGAGFILRERILRLSGLGVLALGLVKLFAYDVQQLDTFARILSFIGLGLLLLAASWSYTRYRAVLNRYLQ